MSIHCLSHVMRHSESKLGARLVLFVLAEHAHDDGTEAYPAIETICERTRMSRRGVQCALRKLEADREIKRDGIGSRGQTKWCVNLGGAQSAPRADDDVGGRSSRPQRGASAAPEPSIGTTLEPLEGERAREARQIFDAWVTATERDPARTQFTADRRRCILKALASHGIEGCLAAVRNIGASQDARTGYGRGTRFDDVKHALHGAERIEKWRDWQPPPSGNVTPIRRGASKITSGGNLDRFAESNW